MLTINVRSTGTWSASTRRELGERAGELVLTLPRELAEALGADGCPERPFLAAISAAALGIAVHQPSALRLAQPLDVSGLALTRIRAGATLHLGDQ